MHSCKDLKQGKFEVYNYWQNLFYIYDKLSHVYIFGIRFCPFCGGKL